MKKIQAQHKPSRRRLTVPLLAAAVAVLLAGTVLAASLGGFDFSRLFGDRAQILEQGTSQYTSDPEDVLEAREPAVQIVSAEDYHFQLLDSVQYGSGLLYARFDVSRVDEAVPDFPATGSNLRLGDDDGGWFTEFSDGGSTRIVVYALADGTVPETVDVALVQDGTSWVLFADAAVTELDPVVMTFDKTGGCVLEGAELSQVGLTVWGRCTGDFSAEAVLTSAGGYPLQLHDTLVQDLVSCEEMAQADGAGYLVRRTVNDDGSFRLTWLFSKPFAPACQSLTFGGVSYEIPDQTPERPAAQDPYVPVLGTSADTQDYRFTLETVSATPNSVCAVVHMEPLTDYGRSHLDVTPELVVHCVTAQTGGTSGAIPVETGETGNRYLVYTLGCGPELLEAGDILSFELLSILEAGDTAEHTYHLFDTALEQVTESVTAVAEGESRYTEVRLTPMTISLTGSVADPGDHGAVEEALSLSEIVLTYENGAVETILDGTASRAEFGQPGILAAEQRGTRDGMAHQTYLFSLPVDLTALEIVTIDGVDYHLTAAP